VNIVGQIEARMEAGRTAVWEAGRATSYGELLGRVRVLAESLRAWAPFRASAVPRIGVFGDTGLDYIVTALAVLKAGGCFVPVAGELAGPERAEVMRTTALHGILLGGSGGWLGARAGQVADGLRGVVLDGAAAGFPVDRFEALQPAFVRFSSGTTGRSKGVVLSHESLRARIESANRVLAIGPGDRVLWVLPMAHHFAVSIVLYLYFGATTVVATAPMGADVLETAAASGATVVYGAPFHHALLAADRGSFRWPTLRLAVSTAAPLPGETAARFLARFGRPLTQGLGIIECGLPVLNTAAAAAKPEAVGQVVPGWELALRDEAGNEAAAGMLGELHLRGPGMFDAYLEPWQTREEVTRDAWFATGDLAVRDAGGDLFLKGRSKSVINVGGMKVFPEEVEVVLESLPGVRRCRVLGRAHPVFGAVPVAELVLENGVSADPAAWRAACRARLSAHKVPVAISVVEAVELTASGKVRR